jgi:hypothetical protein
LADDPGDQLGIPISVVEGRSRRVNQRFGQDISETAPAVIEHLVGVHVVVEVQTRPHRQHMLDGDGPLLRIRIEVVRDKVIHGHIHRIYQGLIDRNSHQQGGEALGGGLQ